MKSLWVVATILFATSPAAADRKFGKQVRFAGFHPVPKSEGGGMCHIRGPHVHIYAANKLEYRTHDDDYVFVGDPAAYGWDGPKYSYKGAHPIQVDVMVGGSPDTEYCYIDGPHYHVMAPPEGPDFQVAGDAYFYVGDPPKVMIEARPQYVGINAYYKPMTYVRPSITVAPPPHWIGARVEFVGPSATVDVVGPPPVVVAPSAAVVAPGIRAGIDVVVPVPSVSVDVNIGGGVIVGGRPTVIVPAHKHKKFKHKKFKRR